MLCYRDMTFCSFYKQCAKASKCHRPLTPEVIDKAKSMDIPIAGYMSEPGCFEKNENP